jgi:hypothetical protein
MVNDFGYGKYLEVFRSSGRSYAALIVNSPTATSSKWYINYSMEIICLDYVKDEKGNQDRVNSDTIAIIRDLENTIRYSNRWQAFSRVDADFSYQKVDEFGADKAFGWIATFTLKIKKRHGICEIESLMPEYDFETQSQISPVCEDATVNVNSSLFDTIASGGTLNVPVVNTADADAGTIGGGKVTIADVDWTDSDGSPQSDVYGDPIVCTPAASVLNTSNLYKTGATTSSKTGDDGQTKRGRGADFFNLDFNNPFLPHDKAYTGKTGGYELSGVYYDKDGNVTTEALAFPDGLVLNWKTWDQTTDDILVLDYNLINTGSPNSNIAAAPYTRGGFAGFYVTNVAELESFFMYDFTALNWAPISFAIGGGGVIDRTHTSTSVSAVSNLVYINAFNRNQASGGSSGTVFLVNYLNIVTDFGL